MIAICAFANWGGFLFLMSLYLQEDRGFSAVGTGAMLVPPAIAVLICSPLSGRAVGRWGTRPSLVIAGIALLISSSMMLFIDDAAPVPLLAFMFFIFGLGFGMINAPITNSAVAGMPRHRAGAASAVASTSRQIGVSLGVALAGSVTGLAAAHTAIDFSSAMTAMWWIVIAFSAAILVLGIVSTTPWALRTAQTVSDRLIEPEMSHA